MAWGFIDNFGGPGLTSLSLSTPFVPDTSFVFRFHSNRSGNNEWYVNGSLVASYASSGNALDYYDFGQAFGLGVDGGIYYMKDLKIGTTAGGTDIFSDSLASLPTGPTYRIAADPGNWFTGDTRGIAIQNNSVGSAVYASPDIDLNSHTEVWFEFTWQAPMNLVDMYTAAGFEAQFTAFEGLGATDGQLALAPPTGGPERSIWKRL